MIEQSGRLNALTTATSSPNQANPVPRTWNVGQVLSATVLSAGTGGAASLLRVAGDTVQAHTRLPLEAGQSLRLQVTEAGPPTVLQVVSSKAADDVPTLASQVLRAALPQQRPLTESLAILQRVSEQPHARRAGDLPDAARALLSDLLASLPRPQDAGDGARLAAMVRASGLFFEAERARQAAQSPERSAAADDAQRQAGADFKARAAALADTLRQAVEAGSREGPVKEADSALRAVLARIEANQAVSVRGSQEQGALWRMDLPFTDQRGPHAVGMRIRREDAGAHRDGGEDWVVELDVQPPGSPPLHARVSLTAGAIHTLFTTEDPQTLSRLNERSAELEQRLAGEALTVGGVRSRLAAIPVDRSLVQVTGLVDERA